jgi:hypothetical protein
MEWPLGRDLLRSEVRTPWLIAIVICCNDLGAVCTTVILLEVWFIDTRLRQKVARLEVDNLL